MNLSNYIDALTELHLADSSRNEAYDRAFEAARKELIRDGEDLLPRLLFKFTFEQTDNFWNGVRLSLLDDSIEGARLISKAFKHGLDDAAAAKVAA